MTISPLPTPPSRADSVNFRSRSDAFLAALPAFATEANQLADDVEADAVSAGQSASAAELDRIAAQQAAVDASAHKDAAAASAVSAANSRQAVVTTEELNLGEHPVPPTTNNQGGPLRRGAVYWNTTLSQWFVWSGTVWTIGLSAVAGVTSINGQQGAVLLPTIAISGATGPFYVGQTRVYTITNFSSFSTYNVTASAGTVSRSGDQITLVAPSTAQTVVLTITQDGVPATFSVSVLANAVLTPNVSVTGSPSSVGETPTITTSAFATAAPSDTHASTTWRVRRQSDNVVVWQSANNASNLLSITVPAGNLIVNTAYVFEAIHNGTSLGASAVGSLAATTAPNFNNYIATPTATPSNFGDALEGGFYAGMIWNEVTTSATSRTLVTGSQTFTVATNMAATPLFYAGQQLEVRSRANPNNRFQGTVTGAIGTTLTINVATITGSGTFSDWSVMARYRVIVAPKSSGQNNSITWKNANTAGPVATQTLNEGWRATEAMRLADTSTVYPAAHWCRALSIGGFTDWYMPARDELELCWRNLKPVTNNNDTSARPTGATATYLRDGAFNDTAATHGTNNNSAPPGSAYTASVPGQVAATAFRTGGAEAFDFGSGIYYWSSTEYSASFAWYQSWDSSLPGNQLGSSKTNSIRVRAVRRSII